MILGVIRKEILVNITSPKLVITYAVCTVLILSAMFTGAMNYLALKEEAEIQGAAEKDRLANVTNFQLDFMLKGMDLYRHPDILSVLVSGVEGDAARRGNVNLYTTATFDVSKFNTTPILAVFGMLDLDFIVKIILSLFAILFTFDAISGEKELGTLKLNFANSLSRGSFIVGKLIGNFILLLIPFVVPFLLGLLVIQFIPGISFTGEDWTRIGLIFLASTLFLLVFYGMGMMVSALTSRPVVSFLVLLMLWVFFVGIAPRLAVLAAQTFYPVPPIDEVSKEYISEFGSSEGEFYSKIRAGMKDLLDSYRAAIRSGQLAQRQDELNQKQEKMMKTVQVGHEEFSRQMQERGAEIDKQQSLKQERQNQLAVTVGRLTSPVAAFTFAADRLSKTGVYSSFEQFKENITNYLRTYTEFTNDIIRENPNDVFQGGQGVSVTGIDYAKVYPDVTLFDEESLEKSVISSLQDFAMMAILALVFLAASVVAFLRYDVR
jgi:ABC-type transport system involved in multi-copper enzyme maturation permease subunit